MRLKPGVKLDKLTPQMALGAVMVDQAYIARAGHDATITSGSDGQHMVGSKHGEGNALDFRTKDLTIDKQALVADVKQRLGENYDVLLENLGKSNEHMHVEYDPI